MEKIFYFVQVSLCVSLFYALYLLFFRKTSFFIANRIYLLAALAISFLIPMVEVSVAALDYHEQASAYVTDTILYDMNASTNAIQMRPAIVTLNIIPIMYWLGVLVQAARFFYTVLAVLTLRRTRKVSFKNGLKIYYANIPQPFCFFKFIFLPVGGVNRSIIEHEKGHVQRHHWLDLILIELTCALLWFNPVMIFYRKSLKLQHEYEADAFALRNGVNLKEYLESMLLHLKVTSTIGPISQFYSKQIKSRILMMTKEKTNRRFSLAYMLSIPVICILLFAFSKPSLKTVSFSDGFAKNSSLVIVVDAGHGGSDLGVANNYGIMEKELVLELAKHIQKIGSSRNIAVVLTRENDNTIELSERVEIANQHAADLFISLHTGSDPRNSWSGIHCVISGNNSGTLARSRRLAENVMQQFQTVEGISINEIKKSNAYVLSKNSIPAVLLELGNLSNERDNIFLKDSDNLKKLSERIVDAVINYSK